MISPGRADGQTQAEVQEAASHTQEICPFCLKPTGREYGERGGPELVITSRYKRRPYAHRACVEAFEEGSPSRGSAWQSRAFGKSRKPGDLG